MCVCNRLNSFSLYIEFGGFEARKPEILTFLSTMSLINFLLNILWKRNNAWLVNGKTIASKTVNCTYNSDIFCEEEEETDLNSKPFLAVHIMCYISENTELALDEKICLFMF